MQITIETPKAPTPIFWSIFPNLSSFIPSFMKLSSPLPLSSSKKVTIETQPTSIQMIWQTNFQTPGADSGSANFTPKNTILNKNAIAIQAIQTNYAFKPIKTWQVSIIGNLDTYFGSEYYRVYFEGDIYISGLSSNNQGLFRFSENGKRENRYYPLSNNQGSWHLSPNNSSKDFQTLICYDAFKDNFSFSIWDLNQEQPKQLFMQEGFVQLSGNIDPFKILAITTDTYSLQTWDIINKKLIWSLDKCFVPSSSGSRPQMGPYINKNWQLVSYGAFIYCFDLNSPKMLWKTQLSSEYIDKVQVADDKYILVKCNNFLIQYSLDDGSFLRQFEIEKSVYMLDGLQLTLLDKNNLKKPLTYDLESGKISKEFQETSIDLKVLYLYKTFLVGCSENAITTWDFSTGDILSTFSFPSNQKYDFLDASGRFLVIHIRDNDQVASNLTSKKKMLMLSESIFESPLPVDPVPVINFIIWDIQQQSFVGSITEKLNDISTNAPMLISFKNGTFTCSWISKEDYEIILIKDYAGLVS